MSDSSDFDSCADRQSISSDLDEWFHVANQVIGKLPADTVQNENGPAERTELERRFVRARKCLTLLNGVRGEPLTTDETDVLSLGVDDSRRLGRFEILRRLGGGAHAIVYLARDPILNRNVALKVPRFELIESNQLRQRFVRESETVAGLSHPNLVPVYDLGFAGPVCFIAQAFVEGPSLRDWVASEGPMPADVAARVVEQIARAVEYVHGRGIVHRDIKPGNILLDTDDWASNPIGTPLSLVPKLTDFGLAKVLEPSDQLTHSHAIIGTPAYMAPEQVDGRIDTIGPATDIYGLGATLYEMLTGQPPFRAESTWETLQRIRNSRITPPRKISPQIPHDLEAICLKCLDFESSRRYSTAYELANDLGRFLKREPVTARLPSPWERAAKWARRRPLVASLLFLLAFCIVSGFSLITWQWQQASRQRDLAAANFQLAHRAMRDLHELAMSDKRYSHPKFDEIREVLMASAHDYLRRLRETNRVNDNVDWDIAETGYRLAHASLAAKNYVRSIEYCKSCISEWGALARGSNKPAEARYYLAKTYRILGMALAQQGAGIDVSMINVYRSEDILKQLIEVDPQNHNFNNALAETYITAASLSQLNHDLDRAMSYSDMALERRKIALHLSPDDQLIQRQLAEAHYRRAARFLRISAYECVEDDCVRALNILEPLGQEGYSQPTTSIYVARCLRLRADAARLAGKNQQAATLYATELATLTELANAFPGHAQVADLLEASQQREVGIQATSANPPDARTGRVRARSI